MNMNKNKTKLIIAPILLVFMFFFACLLPSCSTNIMKGVIFNTIYEIEGATRQEQKNILKRLEEIESNISTNGNTYPTSDVYRLNSAHSGLEINVGNDFIYLFEECLKYNSITKSFNPTIYPLVKKWHFDHTYIFDYVPHLSELPSEHMISSSLLYCNLNNLNHSNGLVSKKVDGTMIDFGAIAKGYAVDQIFEMIKGKNKTVNIGGTIKTSKKTRVAVLDPRTSNHNDPYTIIDLNSESIATSGDYFRYYEIKNYEGFKDGRYHHIIDPGTGYPSGLFEDNPVISATVIGPRSETCDVLSTVFMIEKVEIVKNILSKPNFSDYSTLLIYKNKESFKYGKAFKN